MFKKKFFKFANSLIKIFLPLMFKIFIKLKVNRRVINYLQEKSYFSNERYNFSEKLNYLLKNEKLIALDVGAQGGFNSDNFFPTRYNSFFDCIMVEPIKSEAEKIKNAKYIITKALWSKKERKKFFILDKRLGSSSMFKPDREKFDLHDIKKKEFENYDVTRTIELECDTLENSLKSLNIKNLDYLKIDTQGAELEILKGIGKYRPFLIKIEVHIFSMYKNTPNWHELVNLLYNFNYVLIDWKGIGKHKSRIASEMDMLFIPNFNNVEGQKVIRDNIKKIMSLLLIFGQINILKLIMKRLKIDSKNIDEIEDLYFN